MAHPQLLLYPTTEDATVGIVSPPQAGEEDATPSSPLAPVPPSPTSPGTVQKRLQAWNPMEKDFLSTRNIYKIDDEDASSALQGYSEYMHEAHSLSLCTCMMQGLWSYT